MQVTNWTRATTCHHSIAMKLGMHVLHITAQRGFLGFSNFEIFSENFYLFEISLDLGDISAYLPHKYADTYILTCATYTVYTDIGTHTVNSIHYYLNIDTYRHWHPYSIHWYLNIEAYAFALMLILEHWYLYTLAPIQYTLILEHWYLCICTYVDTWTLILIYIATHTVYTDTWTLILMHLHLCWYLNNWTLT